GIKSVDIFPTAVDTVSVIASTDYTFQCNTIGKPMATMEWYIDNKTPAFDDDTQITSDTRTSSIPNGDLVETQGNLTLPVRREDQDIGVYCRAKNAGRWFTSRTIKINVLYGPKMKTLQDISVVRGKRFEYQCLYEPGNPPSLSFVWTRSETIANWTGQNTQNLTIPSVQRSDEDSYTCNVSNGAENLQFLINNVSNASVEIEEHSTNNLQCSLESDPASHMIIAKDGETILERTGVQTLTHEIKAECSDTGVYNCSGYNQYGKADDASVRLLVK
ncbi:HMCN1-like protein, partial [Mya arenaria]